MRTIVVYDDIGNITSIAIPAEAFAGEISLEPESGEHIIHVDSAVFGPERELSAYTGERLAEEVKKITEDFRIVDGKVVRNPHKT